jgi:hypothetical protein
MARSHRLAPLASWPRSGPSHLVGLSLVLYGPSDPKRPSPPAAFPSLLLPLYLQSLNDPTVKSPLSVHPLPSLHHSTPSPLPTPLTHHVGVGSAAARARNAHAQAKSGWTGGPQFRPHLNPAAGGTESAPGGAARIRSSSRAGASGHPGRDARKSRIGAASGHLLALLLTPGATGWCASSG